MDLDPQAGASAQCALHPDRPAQHVCDRCGNYMCDVCDESGAQRGCPSCRARFDLAPFPVTRATFSVGGVLEVARDTFKAHWLMLSIGTFIYLAVSMGFSFLGQALQRSGMGQTSLGLSLLLVNLLSMVIGWLLMLGMLRMAFDALDGRAPNLATLFSQGGKVWKLVAATVVFWVAVFIPFGLLVGGAVALDVAADLSGVITIVVALIAMVPLIYVSFGMMFVANEIVYDDGCGPIEAIRRSWAMVDGHRLPLFGLGLLLAGVSIVGVMACCVGIVPAYAFIFLALTAAHRGLRNGMELPDPTRPVEF